MDAFAGSPQKSTNDCANTGPTPSMCVNAACAKLSGPPFTAADAAFAKPPEFRRFANTLAVCADVGNTERVDESVQRHARRRSSMASKSLMALCFKPSNLFDLAFGVFHARVPPPRRCRLAALRTETSLQRENVDERLRASRWSVSSVPRAKPLMSSAFREQSEVNVPWIAKDT